jgi:two-component system, OmpR family, phosphate regulon response regulator PhoB
MATILVVDDDPVAQRVLSAQLRKAGHAALGARSGAGALQQLAEAVCDLVILDIGLPDMDGLTLLRLLRADARSKNIPVVMLTASGQAHDSIAAEAAGANAFLRKPASTNELTETVARFLKPRGPED